MTTMITFWHYRWENGRRVQHGEIFFTAICLMIILMFITRGMAGENDRARGGDFHYRPFSEAEIKAAIQKPLLLDDCIRIALAKNINLKLAEGDLGKAEATHSGSYGKFLPVFSVEGTKVNSLLEEPDSLSRFGEARFDNNTTVAGKAQLYLPTGATFELTRDFLREVQYPTGQPITKNQDLTYAINFTQPLLRGAGPKIGRSSFLSSGYDKQIQEKQLLNTKLQTVLAVKSAYYEALAKRELIKVQEAAVRSDSNLIKASEALMLAKMATRRDVLSAEIRFADDRAALIKSQTDYQLALDDLKYIMGLPIEMPIELDSTGLSYAPVTLDEAALIRTALENNPSIHSAELTIRRSQLQHSVAKNSVLPQLDLVASYSSNLQTDLILNQHMGRTGGWQAKLNLSYSFLSRDAAASAENAQIALSQQEDRLLDLQRQIVRNIRDIVRSVYTGAEELSAIKRGIEVAEEKLAFATTMFNLGRASNFDITDAQEFLLKAQNQYLSKLVDYHTQLALLESLTGQPVTP
ncbi:MAG: TolC family protein [candidate division KSB1 bacterium]|nr:TolC family protein [candidate division KSB1 bacterium]MDZ7302429.1 TolC family protein [candidate division KSB1 bacterium]MDZ7311631.1 TolC family protein [candidate division KSB1 bacterium]